MKEKVLVFRPAMFPIIRQSSSSFMRDVHMLPEILASSEFLDRDTVEQNPTYKQIIPYSILRYKKSIFRYRRSPRGSESRLRGLYSLGVGGHINKSDELEPWADPMSIVESSRDRELREEFRVENSSEPSLIGLINDETNNVGRVHFGIVYEYWLNTPLVVPQEQHLHVDYSFVSLIGLRSHKHKYESWSRLLIDEYLLTLREV
jgi:predicted NUDIX family phosphoesterase